jgi:ABC-type Fe3+ transport system permease subunit
MLQVSTNSIRTLIRRSLAGVAVLAIHSACYAQSCALCYTQAASAGSRIIHGLRSGILVLVIPPMFMSIGITILAYRKRNQFNRSAEERARQDW